ncbi:MAG: 5-(carboxyamino)imidazole ribonucleotide mutase [Thermoplasmata archaeon]
MPGVMILIGSRSDLPVAKSAAETLAKLGVPHSVHIASAHRSPERLRRLVESSDAEVFIAVAGLSAALPGAVASRTIRPVIGVPVSGKLGLDAILSVVQMPPGVPVAAVGLDSGANAALLAARILALSDRQLAARLEASMREMEEGVARESEELERELAGGGAGGGGGG